MRNVISLCLLLVFCCTAVNAQPKDEKALAAAVERLNQGILDPEKALLESIASEALSYGHSGGIVQGKAKFVDDLIHGTFDFQSIRITEQTISISGDNAIVRHNLFAKATDSGVPEDVRLGILLVWRREKGEWKLLARQAFKL
jgi:ketosteroid isomerase-like protein